MVVSIRMTKEEKELAESYAKIHGMSLSELIKKTLFEMIGDSEFVHLNTRQDNYPIVIPNTDRFLRIMASMTPQDYETIMKIYTRTYDRMKKNGEIDI